MGAAAKAITWGGNHMRAKFMAYINGTIEALDFYCKAFNAKSQNCFKNADSDNFYAHAEIVIDEQAILGISERLCYNLDFTSGNAMQFWLLFDNEQRVKAAYDVLKDNAEVRCPPSPGGWCEVMVDLTDKYGIRWLMSYEG
jgi:PhnB protein